MGEPLDNERLMRKSFCPSIGCAFQTTNEPSDVNYNVLVGCYVPPCCITYKEQPLDNARLMRKSFCASISCALKTTNESLDVIYNVLVGCYIPF